MKKKKKLIFYFQINVQKDLIQLPHQTDQEEIQNLREKVEFQLR
jgi:hypothetical protein